jgi:hypothetical protein
VPDILLIPGVSRRESGQIDFFFRGLSRRNERADFKSASGIDGAAACQRTPQKSGIGGTVGYQCRHDGSRNFFRGKAVHAAEVDGALAQEARAAGNMVAQHAAGGAAGTGQPGFGGAEQGDERHAQKIRKVHRAGIVGQERVNPAQGIRQLSEARFARQVACLTGKVLQNFLGDFRVRGCSQDAPFAVGAGRYLIHRRTEFCRRPAFGGSIFGARHKADDWATGWGIPQWRSGWWDGSSAFDGDMGIAVGVVLRTRDLPLRSLTNDLIQKKLVRAVGEADAARNARTPCLKARTQ